MQGLKDGSIRLMSGFRTEAVEMATGQVVEHGKVVGGVAAKGATWPVLLSSAVASAAAAQQQQQLTF